MSTTVPTQAGYEYAPEVLAFAGEHGLTPYLEPLRQAILRLFPTALSLEVRYEADAELPHVRYLVFECGVPKTDVPDLLAADRSLHEAARQIVPGRDWHLFICYLRRVVV